MRSAIVHLVESCTRYPWFVLVSAAVIAAAAGLYAVDHFAITTNVNNLLSSRLPSHERETQYVKVFSDRTIIIGTIDMYAERPLAKRQAISPKQPLDTPR